MVKYSEKLVDVFDKWGDDAWISSLLVLRVGKHMTCLDTLGTLGN